MKIINVTNLTEKKIDEELCVALGTFDGLHLGHQKLLDALDDRYKKALLTFKVSPQSFFDENYRCLTTLYDKAFLLQDKIDYLIVLEFNDTIRKSSKEDFIKFLKINNVKKCICGHDYTFGYDKEGNQNDILKNFDAVVIPHYDIDGIRVSTSYIKSLIKNGDVGIANKYLGRYYSLNGRVVYGNQLGRTIGFPTANIIDNEHVIPKCGVYKTLTMINNNLYKSMTNIGYNPTFNKQDELRIETNIFGFDKDIYNSDITVYFVEKIRDEMKFGSKDDLINELKQNQIICNQ